MKYIVLEDEMIAAQRLVRMIKEINPELENVGILNR